MKRILLFCFFSIACITLYAVDFSSTSAYRISPVFSGNKSLSIKNSSLNSKIDVVTWTETDVNAQKWKIEQTPDHFYFLTNIYSDKSLHYTSTRPKAGDKTDQDLNDKSSYFQWELVPVNNPIYPNTYFIRFSLKSSDNYLYLEQQDDVNGSAVKVQLKNNTVDSLRQMWKIEPVTALPNGVTPELRDEVMNGWKDYYYKQASVGHVLGSGGWWGDAEMIETVLDAFETTGNIKYKEMFEELYSNFTYRNKTDWSYNEYNDDIAWMVIAAVRGYLMFDNRRYLGHAQTNFDKMYSRALLPSGMMRWKETPLNNMGTNSCINGPAGVAACYLAIATGDDTYFEKAKKIYALQRQYLFDAATGKVYDSGTWNNGVFSVVNSWSSTYNQGTSLGVALMLYNHYKDEMYKNDALKIVEWTKNNLCDANGVVKVCGSGNDLQGFKGILMRYLRRYIVDLAQPTYVDLMQRNALQAFNNRNSKRISWTAWWEKSTENFTFSDGYNYSNQPFGASTAVSAAFNAPLDKSRIIKDAYKTMEAEYFDYLRGVVVENKSISETVCSVTTNATNYYTAYSNVDFGVEQPKSITLKVWKGALSGTIEVRLSSPNGKLLGTVTVPADNSASPISVSCNLTDAPSGLQHIFLVYNVGGFQVDNFCFLKTPTGLKKNFGQHQVEVFPNPVKNELSIKTQQGGYVVISDSLGKMIYSAEKQAGTTNLHVGDYSKGLYLLSFITDNKKITASFIKN